LKEVQEARTMYEIAKKQAGEQSAQKSSPGPREYGSWTIQTYQGRWIDPGSPNPRSNDHKHAAHRNKHIDAQENAIMAVHIIINQNEWSRFERKEMNQMNRPGLSEPNGSKCL
jgi:hypothetical protein